MSKPLHPESLMMTHGYSPELSEGAVKAPLFQTSTFVFKTAEEGKSFFEVAYGLKEPEDDQEQGLIYSRINNPNLEIFENRLKLWDKADDCAVFESGMAAISTVFLEFLKPGDLLIYSSPTYGGTDHFINDYLKRIGVESVSIDANDSKKDILARIHETGKADKVGLFFIETPSNPTNSLIDIAMCKEIADELSTEDKVVKLAVDNTFMGPIWCHPIEHGADLVVYSATKYIGGHSDLLAGAVLGNTEDMIRIKTLRTFLGNMASPHTSWMLTRSLETLKVRMEQQAKSAEAVASYLLNHPKVLKTVYLGHLEQGSLAEAIYQKQYSSPGAMISFEIKGGEPAAFQFLNKLKLIKLAVSLGSTESLIQHPASMTHAGIAPDDKLKMGITEGLVRISIGVEHYEDLIQDIAQALE